MHHLPGEVTRGISMPACVAVWSIDTLEAAVPAWLGVHTRISVPPKLNTVTGEALAPVRSEAGEAYFIASHPAGATQLANTSC